jgi:MFS family permease
VLLAGMAGFIAASAACAAAATSAELIGARAVQGLAGAVMLPQVFGLISDLFEASEMGKAFAVFSPVMGLSAMLGPIVSGGLIGLDLFGTGWRMIFLVNVPVGLAALAAGAFFLPAVPARAAGTRLDLPGAALAGVAMFLLVFPLVQGHELGWPGWRKRAGGTPLIEPGIFANRGYASGIGFSLAFISSMGGIVVVFNVLLQAGLGYTPWHSAITTAPWAAGAFIGSAAGGMTMARLGRRVLHAGLVVEAAGLLALAGVLREAGTGVSTADLLGPMIVGGIGMGMVFVPLFDIAMAGIRPHEMGSASGVLQTVNSLSMSTGVAGLGVIFFSLLGSGHTAGYLSAAQWTALATVGLLVSAFAVAFWLPRRARETAGAGAAGEPERIEPVVVTG